MAKPLAERLEQSSEYISPNKPDIHQSERFENDIAIVALSSLATREEQMRLFQEGGFLHIETLPVFGMGVRNKIILGMNKHNGTEPDFEADDLQLLVRLKRIPNTQ